MQKGRPLFYTALYRMGREGGDVPYGDPDLVN